MIDGDQYALGYRQAEQERLQQQPEQLGAEAADLFDWIGLWDGARVVELGCGPRGCLDLLSARVGTSGSVVGVEINPEAAGSAQTFVAERGLDNVEVLCGDGRSTGLQPGSFDLVTSRLVLVNVPHPEEIVSETVALARPGGAVAFHESDWAAFMCDPPSAAWTALLELFVTFSQRNGIDCYIGRRLARLLRDGGLAGVKVKPIIHVHPPGDPRRTLLLDFSRNVKERLIAQGLVAEDEYVRLQQDLAAHLEDPDTVVFVGPYVQAWGRKPAPDAGHQT